MKVPKKALKWTAVAGGALIAILLIVNAVLVWTSGAQLEKKIAEIRAAGDPVTLMDLAREPIPPAENAATYLRRAQSDVDAILAELSEVVKSDTYEHPTPSQREIIRSAFEAYPDVIPLLEQAAACDDYDSQSDFALAPEDFAKTHFAQLRDVRAVVQLIAARAALLNADGKSEAALRIAILMFRLTRHFDHESTIVAYLVGLFSRGLAVDTANEALRRGPVSNNARAALEVELALYDGDAVYCRVLKTTRVDGLTRYQTIPGRNLWPYWNYHELAYLQLFDEHIAAASGSSPKRRSLTARTFFDRHQSDPSVFPTLHACCQAKKRADAQIRCLRVFNSLVEPKMPDLDLPAKVFIDPFTSEPLTIKELPGGLAVYSLGENRTDDGPRFEQMFDYGVGPVRPPEQQSDVQE